MIVAGPPAPLPSGPPGGSLAPNVAPTVNLTPVAQQHAASAAPTQNGDILGGGGGSYAHAAGGRGGLGGPPGGRGMPRGGMGGPPGGPGRGGMAGPGRGGYGAGPGGVGGRGVMGPGPHGPGGRAGGRGPGPAPAPAPPVPDEDYNFEEVRGMNFEDLCGSVLLQGSHRAHSCSTSLHCTCVCNCVHALLHTTIQLLTGKQWAAEEVISNAPKPSFSRYHK